MKKIRFAAGVVILVFPVIFPVSAQERPQAGLDSLKKGIEYYKNSDFHNALIQFREVLSDSGLKNRHGDAYFWIAKSNISSGRYEDAAKNLEHFLKNYPDNPYYAEATYEKGRLLFLQGEYEASLQALRKFTAAYPTSVFIPNAFFWAGENLFALGDLKSAERMFQTVITDFPTSFRVEAARYRVEVIELKYRESQLLKLLKWSHEEYLKSLEEYKRRERTYEEAIEAFQRKISSLTSHESQNEMLRLSERIRVLESELTAARRSLPSPSQEVPATPGISSGVASAQTNETWDNRLKLLSIKEEALRLKEFYLDRLIKEAGGNEK